MAIELDALDSRSPEPPSDSDDQRAASSDDRIPIALSSEEPVERWWGVEILDHSRESVDLRRAARNGLPLLLDHDPTKQIGRLEDVSVDADRKIRGRMRFGSSALAQEVRRDVLDGIRTDVSVGYRITELTEEQAGSRDELPVYRAKWMPYEGSIVAVPADITVGVGRDADEAVFPVVVRSLASEPAPEARSVTVSEQNTAASNGAAPTVTVSDRGADIADLCAIAGVPERAVEFIQSGKDLNTIRAELRELRRAQSAQPATPPPPAPINYEDGKHRFNVARAINAAATNDWRQAGFEREVSQDIEKRIKGGELRGVRGTTFYMPTYRKLTDEEREMRAAHVVGTATSGGNLVFTEYGGFIDLLRTRMAVMRLGASFFPGLQGNVAFPRQTSAGEAYWVAEGVGGADVTESNMTFDQVSLSPKTVMARQRYSNQLLAQGVINVDQKIRQDLAAILARKVDLAALHGTGTANDPAGLYAIAGVNEVTFGGGITFAKVVDMEAAIEGDDADIGTMAYLTTPEVKGKAKTKQEFTSEGVPIWRGSAQNGEMNGYLAVASNQVSKTLANGTATDAHGIIFGVWSSLLIGDWGGVAITVDPYTLAGQDQVRIISRYFVDVDVDHPEAFCRGLTLTNT